MLAIGMMASIAANRTALIKTGLTTISPALTFSVSDSIIASATYTITITNPQKYLQHQVFTTTVTKVSGSPSVVVTAYGKVTANGSWVQIGDPFTLTDTGTGTITSATPLNYNYLKVAYVASGAIQHMKVTAFECKTANVYDIGKVSAYTFGDGTGTVAINSSDWDIGTTGNMSGIGTITSDGLITNSATTPLKFTSTAITKGLDFGRAKMVGGAANAAFAYGTWTTPVNNVALAGHYVPIQVNIHNSASAAYDVAAARFRVDADLDTLNTATFINVIEGRSALNGTVAGHAGFNMSTNLASNTTCTGDMIAVLAKFEGSGNVTSSNMVYPLESTVTATGTGIKGLALFDANGCAITDGLKIETHNAATVTNGVNITNTSGTITHDIKLQNGEYIDNTTDGSLTLPNLIRKHTPVAVNATATVSAATMLAGVISSTSAQATSITTPTATAIAALIPGAGMGTAFDLIIDNSAGSSTVTVVLDGSITIVNPAIITGGATLTFATGTTGKLSFYLTSGTAGRCFRVY